MVNGNGSRTETRGSGRADGVLTRYSMLSDLRLCQLARDGDRRASEALVKRHETWIRKCASRWRIFGVEKDDVYSAALAGAMRAIAQFDESRRVRFTTFLWYCIRTECEHMCVFERRRAAGIESLSLSLETTEAMLDSYAAQREPLIEDAVVSRMEADRLRQTLFEAQRGRQAARNCDVIGRLIDGQAICDVGMALGLSPQMVNRIRERARVPLDIARANPRGRR